MSITSFDKKMFEYARQEAMKSTFNRFHVGAVIVYKHRVISSGHNSNRSDPMQKRYNRRYRTFNNSGGTYIHDSLHAEISALKEIINKDIDFSKAKIYVYRVCKGRPKGYGLSRPCNACLHALRDVGIRDIYYTDNFGLSYLRLD